MDVVGGAGIAITSSGNVFVSYSESTNNSTGCGNSAWTRTLHLVEGGADTTFDSFSGIYAGHGVVVNTVLNLAIGTDGFPTITTENLSGTYLDFNSSLFYDCTTASCGSFNKNVFFSLPEGAGGYVENVYIGPDGYARFLANVDDSNFNTHVVAVRCSNASCTKYAISDIPGSWSGNVQSMSEDTNGNPRIIATDPNNVFYHVRFDSKDLIPQGAQGALPVGLSTLTQQITIPILKKKGKDPFSFNLIMNPTVRKLPTSGAPQWFIADSLMGMSTPALVYYAPSYVASPPPAYISPVSYQAELLTCNGSVSTLYANWVFTDSKNQQHLFPSAQVDTLGCIASSYNAQPSDNSGLTLSITTQTSQMCITPPCAAVTDAGGNVLAYANNTSSTFKGTVATMTDPDQVMLSASFGGDTPQTVTFNDTLGTSPIVATETNANIPPATPPPSNLYTYIGGDGLDHAYAVTYGVFTQQTNFGCSGITEMPATPVYLPTSVILPGGSSYSIGYEMTPDVSGSVTGRLASFQLPTGGTTSWVYTGGSHGINCADGTTSGIQMTTPDGVSTFTHIVNTNTTSTTNVTDAAGNLTTSTFYYGTITEMTNPLKTEILCYNGASTNCANGNEFNGLTPGYLSEVKTFTSLLGLTASGLTAQSLSDVQFDPYLYGLLVQDTEYDFGPKLVSTSAITYGTTCGGSSITHDRTCSLLTTDQSGAQASNELDSYNALGDLTQQRLWVSGSNFLTTQYNVSNGIVNSVVDPNGKITSYTNDGCNGMFPTAILYPTGNTSSIVWDCNGALVTSTIDPNGHQGTMTYDLLWRPLQSQDPLSNVTNYSYTPTASEPSTVFNSGHSALDIRFTTDSMGRMQVAQTAQGPGLSTYDTISQTFGPNGKTASISAPCSTSLPGALCSSSAYQLLYDALGRVTSVTNANGGTLTTTWQSGDALEVLGPVAVGETATKRKQLEYDGLNRLTSVCEITSATGSGPCNQRVAASGFLTSYTLDALGRVKQVTQGVQTRTFTYDGLGRLTTAVAPENGTTTYMYDTADGSCGAYSSPGDLVEKKDAMGNISCYQYDSGHRLISRSY
ncbi:MAG TPA: hypothetical protein VK763_20710 [Terriglobales bacterium]|nr:hypothetical protein [Terriglobales bacterium]